MKVPVIAGTIRRRLLINFRVRPDAISRILPVRFAPKLHRGHAIAGICLIRLEGIRPAGLPPLLGISSENAAHRIAVTWHEGGEPREGVYIPRRDTGSFLNQLAGGRVFPGHHGAADFEVADDGRTIDLRMAAKDGAVSLNVRASRSDRLPAESCFRSLQEASDFFEPGAVGYSVCDEPGRLEGVRLQTHGWRVEPLEVAEVRSSWFEDRTRFREEDVEFDCGLLMTDVPHEWHAEPDLQLD